MAKAIGLFRVLVGLTILYSPRLAARALRLPDDTVDPVYNLVSRISGNRDVILGAALMLAPESRLQPMLQINTAADLADVGVSLWELRDGVPQRAALTSAGAAGSLAVLELLLLSRLRRGQA